MAGLSVAADAIVLEKRPAASDGWDHHTLFLADHGAIAALRRQSRRGAAAVAPLDLFDEAEVTLESGNEGRSWFIRDARVKTRHREIGRGYEALRAASAFARVIARNPVGPESRAAVYALLRDAFGAFASGDRPDVVLFKSLYRFARDEGYPVKQEWLSGLAAPERTAAAELLSRPVREAAIASEDLARLQRRLEDYLRGDADMRID